MKKRLQILTILILFLLTGNSTFSQVLISNSAGSPDGSAMLEIASDNSGVLIPRLDRTSITTPVVGLLVYDTVGKEKKYHGLTKVDAITLRDPPFLMNDLDKLIEQVFGLLNRSGPTLHVFRK